MAEKTTKVLTNEEMNQLGIMEKILRDINFIMQNVLESRDRDAAEIQNMIKPIPDIMSEVTFSLEKLLNDSYKEEYSLTEYEKVLEKHLMKPIFE